MLKLFRSIVSFIRNDGNAESQVKWSLYLRVWKEFGLPYWKFLLLGVICTILASSAEGFAITLVQKIIDEGFVEKNMNSLYMIGLELIGAYFLKSIFTFSKTVSIARVGFKGAAALRKRLFKHMMTLSMDFFQTTHSGMMMNIFVGLASAMLNMVTSGVMSIIQNASTLVIMISLMFWYSPRLTITMFILGPLIALVMTLIARRRRVVARHRFALDGKSMTQISEAYQGIKTVQAFCTEKTEYDKISDTEDRKVKVGMQGARLSGIQSPLLEILISMGLCGALIAGGEYITAGELTTGDFTAFLLAMTAAYKPVKSLSSVSGGIQEGLIAAEGLFSMLDRQSAIKDAPDAKDFNDQRISVKLDHVRFAYDPKEGDVVNDLHLDVPAGKICAFVGPSGGGKSTIFNLLLRFYDPKSGSVSFNGTDLRKIKLASLRKSISIVSQDVFLFNDTVMANIRYGSPDATDEQVYAAAKAAYADEFIRELPGGYRMLVGERGDLLSGGQKQRIAIARAILRNSPILLLDEATSALDSKSEHYIRMALEKLMKGRTCFVIAHRLSTVTGADMICYINHGRIIEQGTDEELCAKNGEYKKLKDLQFKDSK